MDCDFIAKQEPQFSQHATNLTGLRDMLEHSVPRTRSCLATEKRPITTM